MSNTAHLNMLKVKHNRLDEKIRRAFLAHYPDEQLKKLKLERLIIRDEMAVYAKLAEEESNNSDSRSAVA